MTVEEQLKALIIERYSSLRKFSEATDLSYTTLDSILKRGVLNSNLRNVMAICNELGISLDSLSNGVIAPAGADSKNMDLEDRALRYESDLMTSEHVYLDSVELNGMEIQIASGSMDSAIRMIRRYREDKEQDRIASRMSAYLERLSGTRMKGGELDEKKDSIKTYSDHALADGSGAIHPVRGIQQAEGREAGYSQNEELHGRSQKVRRREAGEVVSPEG